MKFRFLFPTGAAFFGLSGCQSAPEVAVAPTAQHALISTPVPVATSSPPKIVQTKRSSLPSLPQMMGNEPRPTYVPLPTPKVRPGQTIAISNAPAPTPRENPTLIISNAPVAGRDITVSEAAARGLVWVNTASKARIYHRPGGRYYGGTIDGYYCTEAQARARGYRASLR